jgi:hypothetical protein
MEHRIPRLNQRPELAAPQHPLGPAIAIYEHGGAEPLPVQSPANRYSVEF